MAPPLLLLLFTLTLLSAAAAERLPSFFPRAPWQAMVQATRQVSKGHKKPLSYTTHFYPQQLDHFTFRPEGSGTFYQKYLMNSSYWDRRGGAPIFVYTGNEGNIEWFAGNTGFMLDVAPRFRALLVFIEHRFYGESMPFGKESYKSPDKLGYLSSAQALADFALLIRSLKQNLSADASPVVVFGGSYGGMLAAWFRLKYPHVAIGALASSAPILQFDNITPSTSFYDGVSEDFKDASLNCFKIIKGSWEDLMVTAVQKEGMMEINKMFRPCKAIQSVYPARDWLWSAFVYTAMVDYPTAANFMKPLPAYPVKEMCKIIDGFPSGVDKLTKAIAAASLYYNFTGSESCFQIENEKDDHGLHGWNFQACTEMAMPMSCSNESMFSPFAYDFKQFAKSCMAKYGVTPRPHWITTEYGGHRIEQVLKRFGSNIIFSNGMKDPWSRGGVLKNISDSLVALVTKEGAHHVDFRSAAKEDPGWLVEQRRQEVEIIQKWINEYHAG